jgi:hypothetical protein
MKRSATAAVRDRLIAWLLEPGDPSLAFRTCTELLGRGRKDQEVAALAKDIPGSPAVRRFLEAMHPDGYWLQKNPRSGRIVGDGVEYGSFGTTHFCLSYLSELGLDRTTGAVARAAERYLGLQNPDGDWYGRFSCLDGYNIRTFLRLGYHGDRRLDRSIDLLLQTEREDGGYLCGMHDRRRKRKQLKSCIRGSVKALLAFAELPELWGHPRVRKLAAYFLERGGIYKSTDHAAFVNADMQRPSFPITWRANAWEILYALSLMGYGKDPRLGSAWKHLESGKDERGASLLAWTPAQCPWKVGARGQANKWLTFYALLAAKWRADGGGTAKTALRVPV